MVLRQSRSSASQMLARWPSTPALFTRIWIFPNASMVFSTPLFTSAGLVTSMTVVIALPPCLIISSATVLADAALISATTTSAPSSAKVIQMARPMPFPPPVTTATLSFNRIQSLLIFHCNLCNSSLIIIVCRKYQSLKHRPAMFLHSFRRTQVHDQGNIEHQVISVLL